MKVKYTYWDNSKKAHGALLMEIIADSILEADKLFKIKFPNINLIKTPSIGVQIEIQNLNREISKYDNHNSN